MFYTIIVLIHFFIKRINFNEIYNLH